MIIPAIKNRRSVREFNTLIPSDDLIKEIITAGQYAPSAHGSRAVEYLIIKNKSIKKEINRIFSEESKQEFIETAPILIVPVVDTKKSILPTQDLSVVAENIFLQATECGLGSVWKNVNNKYVPKLLQLFRLSGSYTLINIIPIGYPEKPVTSHDTDDFDEQKIKTY